MNNDAEVHFNCSTQTPGGSRQWTPCSVCQGWETQKCESTLWNVCLYCDCVQNVHKNWAKFFFWETYLVVFFYFFLLFLVLYNFPTHAQQFVADLLFFFIARWFSWFCSCEGKNWWRRLVPPSRALGVGCQRRAVRKEAGRQKTIKLISVQLRLFGSLCNFTSFKGNLKVFFKLNLWPEWAAAALAAARRGAGSTIHPDWTKWVFFRLYFFGEQPLTGDPNWAAAKSSEPWSENLSSFHLEIIQWIISVS